MPRHKYLFGSRQEAEDKVREIDRKAHQQLRLARALYTGGVQWVKNPHRGPYRMGAFDLQSPGGPRIVLVFAPSGQEPDLKVYDFGSEDYTGWKNWFATEDQRADTICHSLKFPHWFSGIGHGVASILQVNSCVGRWWGNANFWPGQKADILLKWLTM